MLCLSGDDRGHYPVDYFLLGVHHRGFGDRGHDVAEDYVRDAPSDRSNKRSNGLGQNAVETVGRQENDQRRGAATTWSLVERYR